VVRLGARVRAWTGASRLNDSDPFPVSVDLIRADNVLDITWEDGAVTRLAGDRLRWACPCAQCRGEAGSPGRLAALDQLPPDELQLDGVSLIGQYALQIGFASGHDTGLYTFRYLQDLGR
jgi:DUF971 family protein